MVDGNLAQSLRYEVLKLQWFVLGTLLGTYSFTWMNRLLATDLIRVSVHQKPKIRSVRVSWRSMYRGATKSLCTQFEFIWMLLFILWTNLNFSPCSSGHFPCWGLEVVKAAPDSCFEVLNCQESAILLSSAILLRISYLATRWCTSTLCSRS